MKNFKAIMFYCDRCKSIVNKSFGEWACQSSDSKTVINTYSCPICDHYTAIEIYKFSK
jgi:hypothetical protein